MKIYKITAIGFAAALFIAVSAVTAGSGEGVVKLGFVNTDEDGSLAVSRESFNIYQGVGFSVEDFHYSFDNGVNLTADLRNASLNNRNLSTTIAKPGLFNIRFNNNQYRRIYNSLGSNFTRRRTTTVSAGLTPSRYISLFGGLSRTDKRGNREIIFRPLADTVLTSTDYTSVTSNGGLRASCSHGSLRAEYRRIDFFDDIDLTNDRKADIVNLSAFTYLPGYRRVTVSGGYLFRTDKIYERAVDLETNQYWGATRIHLPSNIRFEYRLMTAKTTREADSSETDNLDHTVSIGKSWPRLAGVRVGYKSRTSDDETDKSKSKSWLVNGWYNLTDLFRFKGKITLRDKDITEGATLVGDEEQTRGSFSVTYTGSSFGDLTGKFESRVRKNDKINSRVDYTLLSSILNLRHERYGRLVFSNSYYLGKYENLSDDVSYEFSDHVLSGTVYPKLFRSVDLSAGGTYYRSRRDNDIEKLTLNIAGEYHLPHGHHLGVKYNLHTFDNFMIVNDFYTGNIIEAYISKDITI